MEEKETNVENEDIQEVKIEQLDIDDSETNSNYQTEEEIKKDIKTNEAQMKKKVAHIIEDIDDSKAKELRRAKRKNIFFIIGIILEIIVIIMIFDSRNKKKEANNKETYSFAVTCTNKSEVGNYDLSTTNVYYFNKARKVAKTENEITYIFKTREDYEKYKSDYISTDIKNFDGIIQDSVFDDNAYAYKNITIYNYDELKSNKKVTYKNDELTLKIPDHKEPIKLYIEDYDTVLLSNENMGFICE